MVTNKLTDIEVKLANTRASDYKITDGGGLHLLIKNNGTKCWRLAYRFAGKQKTLAIGTYPQIGLRDARKERENAKNKLAKNIDPSLDKKQEKLKQQLAAANTFEAIARDWWQHNLGLWTPNHGERVIGRLTPHIYSIKMDTVEATETEIDYDAQLTSNRIYPNIKHHRQF